MAFRVPVHSKHTAVFTSHTGFNSTCLWIRHRRVYTDIIAVPVATAVLFNHDLLLQEFAATGRFRVSPDQVLALLGLPTAVN